VCDKQASSVRQDLRARSELPKHQGMEKIGIIGGGAWGTALAIVARRAGREVVLWAHEDDVVASINTNRENVSYLPGVTLDAGIKATGSLAEAVSADAVILAAPSQHLRSLCEQAAPAWRRKVPAVICAKGIEQRTGLLMGEVVADVLPQAPITILSGPTFAAEVAADLPTALTLAAESTRLRQRLSDALATPTFRIYSSDDPIGAQVGGAVKNVLAIACGIVVGRRFGDNTRAAIMTRGLAEITRLGLAKGANMETLMGLTGVGDLILTCHSMKSRNFSLGVELGQGRDAADVLSERTSVAEGVFSASSVTQLAGRLGVDMPICLAVDAVLNHGLDLDVAISALMARPMKSESVTAG